MEHPERQHIYGWLLLPMRATWTLLLQNRNATLPQLTRGAPYPCLSRPKHSDFSSRLLTCRKFRTVIQDSRLLQYLICTVSIGVHDPRLESLKQWSAAWPQPGAYLRSPSLILSYVPEDHMEFLRCDDYLVAMDFGGRYGYRHVAGNDWLDLRKQGDDSTKLRFEEGLTWLSRFAGCPVPIGLSLELSSLRLRRKVHGVRHLSITA